MANVKGNVGRPFFDEREHALAILTTEGATVRYDGCTVVVSNDTIETSFKLELHYRPGSGAFLVHNGDRYSRTRRMSFDEVEEILLLTKKLIRKELHEIFA